MSIASPCVGVDSWLFNDDGEDGENIFITFMLKSCKFLTGPVTETLRANRGLSQGFKRVAAVYRLGCDTPTAPLTNQLCRRPDTTGPETLQALTIRWSDVPLDREWEPMTVPHLC